MKIFSKKNSDISICILCFFVSFLFLILLIFMSHKDFSERENRALQQFPKPNLESLADGSFFSLLSDFSADQFPARSFFCSISSLSELAIARNECNNVIVANDGYLIARSQNQNNNILSKNLNAIYSFLEENRDTPSFLLVAPRGIDVVSRNLPIFFSKDFGKAEYNMLNETIAQDKLISARDKLEKLSEEGQKIWYKTDHHWTTKGAYEAYLLICESLGENAYPLEYFNIETATDSFLGTCFSRSGLPEITCSTDTVELFRYFDDENIKVTHKSTKKTVYGFYDFSALTKKDKYQIFLGGNHEILEIRDTKKNKPQLLLIKDSFANSLIPFLALHYDIDVVDLRYYNLSLNALTENKKFDKILLVYGIDTLSSDLTCSNIAK